MDIKICFSEIRLTGSKRFICLFSSISDKPYSLPIGKYSIDF